MKNLKILRQNSHKTQLQVAQELNMPPTTYATYEQNKATPNIDNLIKIANYFGCSIDYLLGHQTKNVLYLDSFTPLQREIIDYIKRLDDDQLNVLKGMFGTVVGVPLEELLKKEGE